MEKEIIDFMQSQRTLTIATVDSNSNPWCATAYYSCTDLGVIFFDSKPSTQHIKNLANNKNVAFNISWFEVDNQENRKGIQGRGICKQITNPLEMLDLFKNHIKYFPDWKDYLTLENFTKGLIESRPFIITPTYMKFWNDELFDDKPKDFVF
jgi:uncharacterized protein YhbP (UPF0306 family)